MEIKSVIGIYYITFLVTASVVIANRIRDDTSNRVRISKKWIDVYGCPADGLEFDVECNHCICEEARTNQVTCYTNYYCYATYIDDWQGEDTKCKPNDHFYHGCRYCKCDKSGKTAECDETACSYYPSVTISNRNDEKSTIHSPSLIVPKINGVVTTSCYSRIGRSLGENEFSNQLLVDESMPLRISEKWVRKYGCPIVGRLFIGASYCECLELYKEEYFCVSYGAIDNWEEGVTTCIPGEQFFFQCSYCVCDETGTKASCDDRACKYYPKTSKLQ